MVLLADVRERVETAQRRSRRRRKERGQSSVRLDIQGLRALAVVLVILDHLAGWPKGGFIGVDVFFVISGFLITGLLVRAGEQHGSSVGRYFGHFYSRRARRILPAALVVLAVAWVGASIAYRGTRVDTNHTDVWWAAGFLANYHFADVGTDYFASQSAPSLVQHFWSLAVEEQFYLVWPVAVFLVVGLAAKRVSRGRRLAALLALVTAVTIGSFVWAVHSTSTSPTSAYFSTPARAWELGVGATLAVAITLFPRLGFGNAAGPLALLGFAGIVLSAFVVTESADFPAPAAALPVLCTALVIAASASNSALIWPLTNRVSQYLGDISYSLYLWHWPAILLIQVGMPHDRSLRYVVTVALTLGLAAFSYALIEEPIHRGRRNRAPESRMPVRYAAVLALACLVVGGVGICFKTIPRPPAFLVDAGTAPASDQATPSYVAQPGRALSAALRQSLTDSTWPDFSPPLSDLDTAHAQASWGDCSDAADGCVIGSGAKTAVLIGDSIAMAWIPTLRKALVDYGWQIRGYMLQQCPAADVPVYFEGEQRVPHYQCDVAHRRWMSAVRALHPGLVILASAENTFARIRAAGAQAAYTAGMEATIRAVRQGGNAPVVTLSPPPATTAIATCDVAGSAPSDCVSKPESSWTEQAAAEQAASRATGSFYVDTHRLFCVETAYGAECPAFAGRTPIRFDRNHLTAQYASLIGSDLRRELIRIAHIR